MREIEFRGKRVDNGKWEYGYLLTEDRIGNVCFECYSEYALEEAFSVIPETIGQFTGLRDKNGKRVYEGDILCIVIGQKKQGKLFIVRWGNEKGGFCINDIGIIGNYDMRKYEVIDNIYDNLNLLTE